MGVTVTFSCGGCFKKTEGTDRLSRQFVSITGRSYGFGSYVYNKSQDVAPEGWVAFDPFTGMCYCPECWAEIEREDSSDDKETFAEHAIT